MVKYSYKFVLKKCTPYYRNPVAGQHICFLYLQKSTLNIAWGIPASIKDMKYLILIFLLVFFFFMVYTPSGCHFKTQCNFSFYSCYTLLAKYLHLSRTSCPSKKVPWNNIILTGFQLNFLLLIFCHILRCTLKEPIVFHHWKKNQNNSKQ